MYFSIYHIHIIYSIEGYNWYILNCSYYNKLLVNTKVQPECAAAPVCPGHTAPAPGSWLLAAGGLPGQAASSLRSPELELTRGRAWTLAQHWREDGLVLGYNTAFLYDPA